MKLKRKLREIYKKPLFFYVGGLLFSSTFVAIYVRYTDDLFMIVLQSIFVGFYINGIIFHYMHKKRRKLYDDMINDLENRVNKTVRLLKLGTEGMAIQNEMIKKQREEIDKLRSEVHG